MRVWCLLELAVFWLSGLGRHLKAGKLGVIPELIEETFPIIFNHLEVNIYATLKYKHKQGIKKQFVIFTF